LTDTEIRDYEITYYRPEPENADVRWTDNQGNEGYVYRNTFHQQSSYYPLWEESDCLIFRGTRLKDNAVQENGVWVGYAYDWGYADNHPNSTEMSKFKIDWAVDAQGNKVALDQIDFVKIYTAVNQYCTQIGELSTEITGVENLHYEK
jgi:alpha-D-ribose 1-methylphosphonate 5-triphosphate synthase subunit PhnI